MEQRGGFFILSYPSIIILSLVLQGYQFESSQDIFKAFNFVNILGRCNRILLRYME